MHKFYTSSYDASIYLQQPDQNAGRDEILEVGKLYYGTIKDVYRTLIKFDVSNLETGSGWRAYLNLKAANSEELPLEYTIYANVVSQSWSMGTGTKFDNITSDGVSWKYRDGINKWVSYDTTGGTAIYTNNTTGSANAEGGVWYLSGSASQSFNYESDDVRMDVTDMVNIWLSGSVSNNGIVVHHSLSAENDTLDYGVLKFFSKETNTIYQPKLEIVWDDSSILTGSLAPVTGSVEEGYKVVVTNLKTQYEANTKIKVRVKGRDKYPSKSFGTTFSYDQSKYLPTTTYYQLEDYITNEIIFPFGNYTKVSCDSTSNYFIMDLSTLPINRTYLLKLKIVEGGISTIIDDKLKFEII
jgi:hypothetical protein